MRSSWGLTWGLTWGLEKFKWLIIKELMRKTGGLAIFIKTDVDWLFSFTSIGLINHKKRSKNHSDWKVFVIFTPNYKPEWNKRG